MPPPPDTPQPLPAPLADFLQSGVSVTVAACNERLVPSITKAAGCRVSPDGRTVTVLLFPEPAAEVLRDLARQGRVAVCFSRPSTHQTVQLKATRVSVGPAQEADVAAARASLERLKADLQPLGFDPRMIDNAFWHEGQPLVALSFEPEDAFAQTPGPRAGEAIPR